MMQPIELILQVNEPNFCQVFVVPLDSLVHPKLRYAVIKVYECNLLVEQDLEFVECMTEATIAAYEFYEAWLDSMDKVDPTRRAIDPFTNESSHGNPPN